MKFLSSVLMVFVISSLIVYPVSASSAIVGNCDSSSGWFSNNTLSVDNIDFKEGTGSLKSVGSGIVQFQRAFSTPINTGFEANQWGIPGYLQFWYYVSDVSKFSGGGQIEIGSSGTYDVNEYYWDMNEYVIPYLKNGWNLIRLALNDASKVGNPNLSSINWVRLYQSVSNSVTTKIDDIVFFDMVYSDCDNTTSWYSNNSISLDTSDYKEGTGALKSIGTGAIQFSKDTSTGIYSGITENEGAIQFWYYVSDVSKFSGDGQIEIGSAGTCDADEYYWDMSSQVKPKLKNGWNFLELRIDKAYKIGNPNLKSINHIRVYQYVSASITTKIDNITFARVYKTPTMAPSPRVTSTTLTSYDVPVITYKVTEFGAVANDGLDDTAAFQAALDAAGYYSGGVVFASAGQYEILTHLTIPVNVTLRGEWKNPDSGGLGIGTILKAYEGRGFDNGAPFIMTRHGATVRDLTIWYPEQNNINSVQKYPWTIANKDKVNDLMGDGYFGPNIFNVTLINSYNGIKLTTNNCHYLKDVYGTVLNHGIYLDYILDIGRFETVKLAPKYWANCNLGTAPSESLIGNYLRNNATGLTICRDDWQYIYDLYIKSYNVGIRFAQSSYGAGNGQLYKVSVEDAKTALLLDKTSDIGIVVSNSSFSSTGSDGVAIKTSSNYSTYNSVSFNTCMISSPLGRAVVLDGSGMLNFNHSTFSDWSSSQNAVTANYGTIVLEGNYFLKDQPDLYLGANVSSASVLGNSFTNGASITNYSSGDIKIDTTTGSPSMFTFMPTELPEISTYRKPGSNALYNVINYGAIGDGVTNDTTAIQNALNAAANNGGGTVYVPAGRYKISTHLSIPSNVELRGSSDGPQHYGTGKGTVLVAYEYQGNQNGTPFITLSSNAGVRGLNIFYPNQHRDNVSAYPATIHANGTGCYVIDVTMPDSYTGIKISGGNYYINYARGFGFNKFIDITGITSKGYILNVMNTMGDWQDGVREDNAPPTNWWDENPSVLAIGFDITNSTNVEMFNNFSFGMGYALKINGTSSDLDIYGYGVDNSEKAIQLTGSGSNIDFINTQLVAIGGDGKRYIYTSPTYTGTSRFFNTLGWACTQGVEIYGAGVITLQQLNLTAGRVFHYGGTMWLDGSFFHDSMNQVYLDSAITDAVVIGNVGNTSGFGVTNNKNDPDIWMNIRK